jgi:hypothetical protein
VSRLALALVALSATVATSAQAYVRSRTTHGTPTAWRANCVMVQPDSTGTADLDYPTVTTVIQQSMQAWATATASCGYLALNYMSPALLDAHYDGVNTIKFRTDRWCHPDDDHSQGVCYSTAAAGITTIFYVDSPGHDADGSLLDADVELNNINFTFAVVDPNSPVNIKPRMGTSLADLENTLVHELGHLQGLDHTCKDSATAANAVDDTGHAPPACSMLAALSPDVRTKITEATMFNSANPGETKKRSPEADDVAGICNAYPIAMKPSSCAPADLGKGCSVSLGQRADASQLACALCLLILLGVYTKWRAAPVAGRLRRPR